eukprot:CAMPEP_0115577528 /NCGR_PEP_ID=MMETSP0272-20121206/3120_1 /TAXON_ID=71861 /ORGANISM="Scrippsiella trochoidea, Strain CCMP3099" /LENGTH=134 /DNA_ID=CAMNT_0003012345 /DNA_START=216 /DNA_END=621 /DNA_ORIENTATION=+
MTKAADSENASCTRLGSVASSTTGDMAVVPPQLLHGKCIKMQPRPLSTVGCAKNAQTSTLSSCSIILIVHELSAAAGFTISSHCSMSRQGCTGLLSSPNSAKALAEAGVKLDIFAFSSQRPRAAAEELSHKKPS